MHKQTLIHTVKRKSKALCCRLNSYVFKEQRRETKVFVNNNSISNYFAEEDGKRPLKSILGLSNG